MAIDPKALEGDWVLLMEDEALMPTGNTLVTLKDGVIRYRDAVARAGRYSIRGLTVTLKFKTPFGKRKWRLRGKLERAEWQDGRSAWVPMEEPIWTLYLVPARPWFWRFLPEGLRWRFWYGDFFYLMRDHPDLDEVRESNAADAAESRARFEAELQAEAEAERLAEPA